MKFWQLTVGLGIGFLLFMSVFTSENQKIVLKKSLMNPLHHQPHFDGLAEMKTSTQYFYTDENQFLIVHPQSQVLQKKSGLTLAEGDVFIAGGLSELGPQKVSVQDISFDVSNKEVFIHIANNKKKIHLFALDSSVVVTFPESELQLIVPVGHKAVIPQDRYFLQQPKAFLRSELNRFFQIKPWYDDGKSQRIKDDQIAYKTWIYRFEDYTKQSPMTWSAGKQINFAAWTSYQLANLHQKRTIGLSQAMLREAVLAKTMAHLVDSFYFFDQENTEQQRRTITQTRKILESSSWAEFVTSSSQQALIWADYKLNFYFWLRSESQSSAERELVEIFYDVNKSAIARSDRQWNDAEKDLSRFFLQKVTPRLSVIKSLLSAHDFQEEDQAFINEKRYLLYRMMMEYPFFQQAEVFKLYDVFVRAEMSAFKASEQKKLQIATEIIALVKALSERNTDSVMTQVLLDLWERLDVVALQSAFPLEIITAEDLSLLENLRLTGGQKIDEEERLAIKATIEFEQDLEDKLAALDATNNQLNVAEEDASNSVVNAPQLLDFFKEKKVLPDLLLFKTSRETGTSTFEKFIYKDRFIAGEFEYESQRFLTLRLSSGESYELISRSYFAEVLQTINASILQDKERLEAEKEKQKALSEKDTNKITLNEPESSVTQAAEKSVLARRFAQRMLGTLPLELQRHNIIVLDNSYQMFGIWNASSGKAAKLAFTFDQVNGKFFDLEWVESVEGDIPEQLFSKSETLQWEEFEAWLLELQPAEAPAETEDEAAN